MSSETIQAVVARYFTATRRMYPDAWVACFAEQATNYEPAAPAPLQGHAACASSSWGLPDRSGSSV